MAMGQPEWVVVVHRDQQDVYERLRERVDATAIVPVLDRRQRERRLALDPSRPQRGPDRRRGRPVAWIYSAGAGFPIEVGEPEASPSRVTDTCALCGLVLEWELPRFPQPPARLDTKVLHLGQALDDTGHAVEIEAFTASGRPLLVHRAQARRRGLAGGAGTRPD
jgi:hypothetical protein